MTNSMMPDSTNPYTPPVETETAGKLVENTSHKRKFSQMLVATVFVSFVMLGQFCLLDFFVVRLRPYPAEVHDYDALVLLIPLAPIGLLCMVANYRWLRLTVGMLIGAILLGLLCSIPIIATVGVWFHFLIGGQL